MVERKEFGPYVVLAKRKKIVKGGDYIDKAWSLAENNVGPIAHLLKNDGVSLSFIGGI